MLRTNTKVNRAEDGANGARSVSAFSAFPFSAFQHFLQKSAKRAKRIPNASAQTGKRCVERNGSARALNRSCRAEHIGGINRFEPVECGVAAKKQIFIFTYQTVHNQSAVLAIETNRTEPQVAGSQRADMYTVAVAQRRRHAWPARPEADRRILLQQAGNDELVRLGFGGHTREF